MTIENRNVVRWQQGKCVLVRPGRAAERLDPDHPRVPDHCCVAFPSDAVRSFTLPVAPDEVKHLGQALPFMLEESLLEDVAELHFAHTALHDDLHAVAVVKRSAMTEWVEALPETLRELPWVSEALCLPWSQGQCTLVFEAEWVLARWDEAQGTRIEATLLPALLSTLEGSYEVLVAYGQNQQAAMAVVPEPLQSRLQWRQGGLAEALLLAAGDSAGPDLRQGAFAPRLPLQRWWGAWRRVAFALCAALILKTGVSVADYQMLKQEDVQLRQAVQDSYRRVNPQGAVVDVEKQLNRQLAEFGAGAQTRAFTPVLVALLSAAAEIDGVTLMSVNYSGGDMRVNLSAPDFRSVEQVREQLGKRSLSAELENSNARQSGVLARLRMEI
ncbi:MAG: type II secretion system protein GspL [Luminiphilus sp.]|jgi:general secretion pathway protein L|nr:type II secretion system protein GspL [Luminiphilus sp.]